MAALDDIKILTSIDNDNLINIYIRKASTAIKRYLNCSDSIDVGVDYEDAVIEYVVINLNKRGNEGMKQFGQGNRSGTYIDDLPESVKNLLPTPYVKLQG